MLLHGRWGRAETWVNFMLNYGDRYRIIAPDQRGHGLSSKPIGKYTGPEMAEDIIALMDELNLHSVILVGHSMGGHIAGCLAAAYPEKVRALSLLDKSAGGPEQPSSLPVDELPLVDPITENWPLPFSSLNEARAFLRQENESDLSYTYFLNSLVEDVDGVRMMFSTQAMAANIAYYQQWFDMLPAIHCPVLIIRAKGGVAVPDEDLARMKAMLTDHLAFTMSQPDHNVMHSDPQEFYGYFDQFLQHVQAKKTNQ